MGRHGLGRHGGDSTTATLAPSPVSGDDCRCIGVTAPAIGARSGAPGPAGSAAPAAPAGRARPARRGRLAGGSVRRLAAAWARSNSVGSSRRYGTLTTTVCGRPRSELRSRFTDWL